MLTDWQNVIALLFVVGAALYVARRFGAVALRRGDKGCGSCGGCSGADARPRSCLYG